MTPIQSLRLPPDLQANQTPPKVIGTLPSRKKAWKAAKSFEGIFIGMLIRDMRKNVESLGEGMFGKAPGSGVQSQLFNNLLSDKMAQSGRIGLARALIEDWERQRLIPKAEPTLPSRNKEIRIDNEGSEGTLDQLSLRELQNG